MQIVDLQAMPGYSSNVSNGRDSVSLGRVTVVTNSYGLFYPACWKHGAMNMVSTTGIWRCLACHEGCYELPKEE